LACILLVKALERCPLDEWRLHCCMRLLFNWPLGWIVKPLLETGLKEYFCLAELSTLLYYSGHQQLLERVVEELGLMVQEIAGQPQEADYHYSHAKEIGGLTYTIQASQQHQYQVFSVYLYLLFQQIDSHADPISPFYLPNCLQCLAIITDTLFTPSNIGQLPSVVE
jgi:hypothetical protein